MVKPKNIKLHVVQWFTNYFLQQISTRLISSFYDLKLDYIKKNLTILLRVDQRSDDTFGAF